MAGGADYQAIMDASSQEIRKVIEETLAQVEIVARAEKEILENDGIITKAMVELQSAESIQEEVGKNIEVLREEENELRSQVDALKSQLGRCDISGKEHKSKRQIMYDETEKIEMVLSDQKRRVADLIETVNTTCQRSDPSSLSQTDDIMKVLNNHVRSLEWIDSQLSSLEIAAEGRGEQ